MAVDLDQVDKLAATVADVYRQTELRLVDLIATYLAHGNPNQADWARQRLNHTRDLLHTADTIVQKLRTDTDGVFRSAAAQAFRAGSTSALTELAGWVDTTIADAARTAAFELPSWGVIETIAQAVNRDINQRASNILRDVADIYRSVIASAVAARGGDTQRHTAQAAYAKFVEQGITGFTDSSGRRWSLPAYVEMATRTVAQRAAIAAHEDRISSTGLQLVHITGQPPACRLCDPWLGVVLSLNGPTGPVTATHQLTDEPVQVNVKATVAEARQRGLFHPQCEHGMAAYLPGVTTLPQPRNDPELYQATQRQRAIERHIRTWKARAAGGLTDQARRQARRKVRAWQTAMREHLDQHPNLTRRYYREKTGVGQTPDVLTIPAGELEPRQERPIGEWTDDELILGIQHALEVENFDRFETLSVESDRRQQQQRQREQRREQARQRRAQQREERDRAKWAQYDQLLNEGAGQEEAVEAAFGVSVEQQRRTDAIRRLRDAGYRGRGFDELARASYRNEVWEAFLAAEDATRGHMLTPEGETKGIDPASLWSTNEATARRYASEELGNWWNRHGRLTLAEWRAQLLGDPGTVGRLQNQREGFSQ